MKFSASRSRFRKCVVGSDGRGLHPKGRNGEEYGKAVECPRVDASILSIERGEMQGSIFLLLGELELKIPINIHRVMEYALDGD